MTELTAIRDLLLPGLAPLAAQPIDPDGWTWRPVLWLEIEGEMIVLRVSEIAEPFPIVMAEEIADGLYQARFRPRVLGALALAKMAFAGRPELETAP